MAYYTRKPELVEAIQIKMNNLDELRSFVPIDWVVCGRYINEAYHNKRYSLDEYLENIGVLNLVAFEIGNYYAYLGEFVIKEEDEDIPGKYTYDVVTSDYFYQHYQPDSCDLDGSGCE